MPRCFSRFRLFARNRPAKVAGVVPLALCAALCALQRTFLCFFAAVAFRLSVHRVAGAWLGEGGCSGEDLLGEDLLLVVRVVRTQRM